MTNAQENRITVVESGVTFGAYHPGNCYLIENSNGHRSLGDGFKMVEFTLLKDDGFYIVEAKSSIPKQSSEPEYEQYWQEILEKMENALLLHTMAHIQRNTAARNELPENMASIDWKTINIKLRLVIPSIPDSYLPPITDAFRKKVKKLKRMWGIHDFNIAVLNEDKARQNSLIT